MSPTSYDPTRLLTTREAASLLGLSEQTLRRWRCCGTGPLFVKLAPNRVAYRPKAVEEFIADRTFGSTRDEAAVQALRASDGESARG